MSDRDVTLRLKAVDEFSATTAKLNSELKKIETQSASSSKLIQHNFRGLNDQLNALSQVGVPGVGRLTGAFENAAAAGQAFGLSSTAATVAIAGTAAAAAGFGAAMFAAVKAASEGEQASMRLGAALKAQGLYSETAAAGVKEWADALLKTKGVNDELSATLVAQGVTMGLSIEKSQQFINLAADMAPIVGSIEAAFDALSRAAQGDERALLTLGKQFGISKEAGLDFGQMVDEIARKTSGNARAALDTFTGQWGLLREEVFNFLEKAGTPLLKFLTEIPAALREAEKTGAGFLEPEIKAVETLLAAWAKLKGLTDPAFTAKSNEGWWKDQGMTQGPPEMIGPPSPAPTAFSESGPAIYSKAWFEQAKKSRETLAAMEKAEADQAKTAAADLAKDREEASRKRLAEIAEDKKAGDEAIATAKAELAEWEKIAELRDEALDAKNTLDLAELRRAQEQVEIEKDRANAALIEADRANDRYRERMQFKLTGGQTFGPYEATSADLARKYGVSLRQAETALQTEKLNAIIADKTRVDEHAQAEAELHELRLEAIEQQMRFALQVAGSIKSFRSGDIGGGISGIGMSLSSLSSMQGIPLEYSGALRDAGTYAAVIGGVVTAMERDQTGAAIGSIVGGIIGGVLSTIESLGLGTAAGVGIGSVVGGAIGSIFDKAPTARGKAEDTVGTMMADWQAQYQREWEAQRGWIDTGAAGPLIKPPDWAGTNWEGGIKGGADVGQSKLGIAQAWSELLGGPSATGNKMLGWLDNLGMSLGEATIAVAKMVEAAQGLSDFEALKVTAEASFTQTGTILTREESIQAVEMYQQGVDGMARRQQIKDEMIAIALDKNYKNSVELQDRFLALNKENVALMPAMEKTALYTEDSAKSLRAIAGRMEPLPDQTTLNAHFGQFPQYHTGKVDSSWERLAVVRKDELIVPPERFGEGAQYLAARGYSAGGSGRSVTINISGAIGDHRDIARKLRREMAYADNRRDVAA